MQDAISRMVQDYELRALAEVPGVTSDWLMDEDEKELCRLLPLAFSCRFL